MKTKKRVNMKITMLDLMTDFVIYYPFLMTTERLKLLCPYAASIQSRLRLERPGSDSW